MSKIINYLLKDIPDEDRIIFCDMLSYISPHIISVERCDESVAIKFEGSTEKDIVSKIDILKDMIQSDEIKQNHEVMTKVVKDYTKRKVINTESIYDQLIESGSIVQISEGVYAYSGLFLKVFKYFCNKIDVFGKSLLDDMVEYSMPVLTKINDYEKGLYFENFPHHIMFQTTLKSDLEVMEAFSKNKRNDQRIYSSIENPSHVLRHAACVPIYPILENTRLDSSMKSFLVSGKCFRNEGCNIFELIRLKEFFMKEYVFVGEQDQIKIYIDKVRALWYHWIDTFQLNCRIETANDSFFASNYKKLKLFQVLGDSKQEFKVWLPPSNIYSAVGSSNIHRTHFTKVYNIKNGDSYCHSACFAFGIERLTYTLLSQKGLDISKWDEQSRKEVFGE